MSVGAAGRYYYRSEGKESGPVSADKLLELFETHTLSAYDEARSERATEWLPIQQAVTEILEARKQSGSKPKAAARPVNPALTAAGKSQGEADGVELDLAAPAGRVQANQLIEQRGAKAPKAAGAISDEDLAQSIAYAQREMRRGWILRGGVTFLLLGITAVLGVHYSAQLHGQVVVGQPMLVETRLSIEGGAAQMSGRGQGQGTGSYELTRSRTITSNADGTVTFTADADATRVRADLADAQDYSELKPGVLRGRTVTLTPEAGSWSASVDGAVSDSLKDVLRFDSSAFYPARRMWPWPWQSWLVHEPEACGVLALDMEDCKAEVRVRFAGFGSCGAGRCARVTFEGEWRGRINGDRHALQLTGEIMRDPTAGIDISAQGHGQLAVTRDIAGPTSTSVLSIVGDATYAQTATPAP